MKINYMGELLEDTDHGVIIRKNGLLDQRCAAARAMKKSAKRKEQALARHIASDVATKKMNRLYKKQNNKPMKRLAVLYTLVFILALLWFMTTK